LIKYRCVTDTQPANHIALASTCYAYLRRAVKTGRWFVSGDDMTGALNDL